MQDKQSLDCFNFHVYFSKVLWYNNRDNSIF